VVDATVRPKFLGPHDNCELELMLAGKKPLSMFVEPIEGQCQSFPEERFDQLVSQGRLVKLVQFESKTLSSGKVGQFRRILYARPEEEWRMKAICLVHDLYFSLTPGWRPDLDRMIGLLLGYDRDDIEQFVDRHVKISK
jgi:hypothetical protein